MFLFAQSKSTPGVSWDSPSQLESSLQLRGLLTSTAFLRQTTLRAKWADAQFSGHSAISKQEECWRTEGRIEIQGDESQLKDRVWETAQWDITLNTGQLHCKFPKSAYQRAAICQLHQQRTRQEESEYSAEDKLGYHHKRTWSHGSSPVPAALQAQERLHRDQTWPPEANPSKGYRDAYVSTKIHARTERSRNNACNISTVDCSGRAGCALRDLSYVAVMLPAKLGALRAWAPQHPHKIMWVSQLTLALTPLSPPPSCCHSSCTLPTMWTALT